jgi:uncharacterized protein (TIGR00251 family)
MKQINIKVIPGSKKEEIIQGDPLIVKVKAQAEKNQANIAALKLLQKHFNSPVRIVKGVTSRRKIIIIG